MTSKLEQDFSAGCLALIRSAGGCFVCWGKSPYCFSCNGRAFKRKADKEQA